MKLGLKMSILGLSAMLIAPVAIEPIAGMTTVQASSIYGSTTPKALRRSWYLGHYKIKGTLHTFAGTRFGNYRRSNVMQITKRRTFLGRVHGTKTYGYKTRAYFRDEHPYGYQPGEMYTQVTYRYKGHNHNGLAVSGHGPIQIYTKTKTSGHVKVLHYGW